MLYRPDKLILSDICEAIVDCEHKTAPTQSFGIPLIRTTDIKDGCLNLDAAKCVSEEIYQEWSSRMEPKQGDIILAREAPIGEVGIVPMGKKVCLGQRTVLIRADREKVYPPYLLYLLQTKQIRHEMDSLAAGSVVPHLNMYNIRNLAIPNLPSMSVQKFVGDTLRSLDEKIELNLQISKTLAKIVYMIFKSWFVDFEFPNQNGKSCKLKENEMQESPMGRIPKGWRVSRIGDEVKVFGGSTPRTSEPDYWKDGSIHWATPKDLSELSSPILSDTKRRITQKGLAAISSELYPRGTVLMSSRAPIGYLSISDVPTTVNQGIIAMVCDGYVSNYYMMSWCYNNIESIKDRANGTTFLEISKSNFRSMDILLPPNELMNDFNQKASASYNAIIAKLKESKLLIELRNTLLTKLLTADEIRNLELLEIK